MPKGHVEPGETFAQTARREVLEETGLNGTILTALGDIEYWFVADGKRIHKTVHHHLIRYDDGDLCDEDPEITEVAWVPFKLLPMRLAYEDERRLMVRARELLPEFAAAEIAGRNPQARPADPVDPARRAASLQRRAERAAREAERATVRGRRGATRNGSTNSNSPGGSGGSNRPGASRNSNTSKPALDADASHQSSGAHSEARSETRSGSRSGAGPSANSSSGSGTSAESAGQRSKRRRRRGRGGRGRRGSSNSASATPNTSNTAPSISTDSSRHPHTSGSNTSGSSEA